MLRTLLVFSLLSFSLAAQDARGRISGRVLDPSGAPVPTVDVTATNAETGVKVAAKTNDAGAYDLLYLQPGGYTLTVTAAGFKTLERKNVSVRVGDRLTEDLTLEVGQVSESISVTGQATLLETATGSLGRVVDSRRIVDLPLPGGNALSLSRLAPGVVNLGAPNHPSLGPAVEVLSNLSVNGTRSGSIEFTVDGTPSMWGSNAAYAPPTEAVAEFKVQTATYDASVGRAPGGNVNVVLRSGTNDFHSIFHWFHNNNKLQSLDLFQRQNLYNAATGPVTDDKVKSVNPLNILNRFGFTFSGPVYIPKVFNGKNKTFWLYAFEGLTRPGVERGNSFYTVPDAAARGGDFSNLLRLGTAYQIYDPATIAAAPNGRFSRQPLPGNIVPTSRIDAVAKNFMPFWPASNTTGTTDGRNNFTLLPRSLNEFYSHTAKVDHNFNDRHRAFGRYNQTYNLFSSGQVLGTIANGQDRFRRNNGVVFDDIVVISPSLLNDFRIGFTRFDQSFFPLSAGYDLNSLGFHPSLAAGISPQAISFPTINVAAFQNLGTGTNSRSFSNYMTLTDDLSWSRGNHTLRTGAEFRIYREHNYNFANMTPTLNFGTTWTQGPLDNSPAAPIGQDFASFLLGIPSGGQINVNDSAAEQSLALSFYVQDDWRIRRSLTLNLGLRWDYDSPITERFNRSVQDFDFAATNPIAARAIANYAQRPIPEIPASQFRVMGGLRFAGAGGSDRNLWMPDRNNFAPRIGLAWTPMKSTVIRAGYGVFFVPIGADRGAVNLSGYSIVNTLVASEDNGRTFLASLSNPFPRGWSQPLGAAGGLSTDVGRGISFFFPQSRNGYMQRYSFGLQRQLPGEAVVEVTYVGNRGTGLLTSRQYNAVPNSYLSKSPVRDQDTINFLTTQVPNPFFPLPGTNLSGQNTGRQQLLRPYPQYTSITSSEPIGYSWYHSLQMTAERRLKGGVTAQFNWTWSKFMEATGFRNDGDALLEELISDLDRTHRFALSALYELPFGRGKRFLSSSNGVVRQIVGGWQAQAVWQRNTGSPIGFGNVLMVDDIRKARLEGSAQTLDRWFNTDIFNRVPAQQLASNLLVHSSRFSGLRTAAVDNWDISAVKNFQLAEKWRFQFRAEFLNAMNHSNLAGPNTGPTNTLFGRVTATTGFPRYIHFGLKLIH
ncbi:MAG: carboxypeptidase regulatory-like domain-containing protein [Acidobacteria bacterium]|nr:carboxypeptidase regulatory-like domain-containing protein [Acidobacteriota bacterium]